MKHEEPNKHSSRQSSDPFLEQGEEQQPWLVSYADLMTLMFGFFALMFSFATFEEGGMAKVQAALSKSFKSTVKDAPRVKDLVEKAIADQHLNDQIRVTEKDGALEVSLESSFLFDSGKAELVPSALGPLKALIQSVMPQSKRASLVVEGHTDNRPISTNQFKSNWELSSGRAATIVHFFEDAGFPSDRLQSVGFGSTRPLVPNRLPSGEESLENQAKNRRVLIRIIEDRSA